MMFIRNATKEDAEALAYLINLAGMLLSYKIPDPYLLGDLTEYPELIHPLVKLEAKVSGTWYINAVATFEEFRGKGIATRLLQEAENQAHQADCHTLSLIVASENTNAVKLYEQLGFIRISALPVISYEGCMHGGDWLLMTRDIRAI